MRDGVSSTVSDSRTTRWIPALGLLAVVVVIVAANGQFRAVEAWAAQPLVAWVTGGGVAATQDVVTFGLGTRSALGLQITPGCSTSVLIAPFLTIMAAVAGKSTVRIPRVMAAASIGAVVLAGVNLVRLSGIAWATSTWGIHPGFEISHYLVGSIFAIMGFAATLMLSVRILTGSRSVRSRPVRSRRDAHVGRHRRS